MDRRGVDMATSVLNSTRDEPKKSSFSLGLRLLVPSLLTHSFALQLPPDYRLTQFGETAKTSTEELKAKS
jgi:hypothetical protein